MVRILIVFLSFLLAFLAAPAFSECRSAPSVWTEETGSNIVKFEDWVVARIAERNQCWLYSKPIKSTINNQGASEEFCRGASRLIINFLPSDSINGELSYESGYHFDPSAKLFLKAETFTLDLLYQDSGIAWTSGRNDDESVISAFGSNQYVSLSGTAESSVQVNDIFSLSGFKEALQRAKVECGLIDLIS